MMTVASEEKPLVFVETLQVATMNLAAEMKCREQAKKAGKGTKDVQAL